MLRAIFLVTVIESIVPVCTSMAQGVKTNGVTTFPAPADCPIPASPDYAVTVNGQTAFVYNTSAMTGDGAMPIINQAYSYYDTANASDTVVVTVLNDSIPLDNLVIRPRSFGIKPTIGSAGGHKTITFTLPAGKKVMVDPGYAAPHAVMRPALALFANVEYAKPPVEGPAVKVLHSGKTYNGEYKLSSGQTLYIEGGAVLEGTVRADIGAKDITIMGHGIIDHSKKDFGTQILLQQCRNVTIDGVILASGSNISWGCVPLDCTHVTINDLKKLSYKPNNDAIDICGGQDITIKNCFIRSSDDSMVVKGTICWTPVRSPAMDTRNVLIQNCVIWNDRATAMCVGEESWGNMGVDNVTFDNIDVIGAYFMYVMNVGGLNQGHKSIQNITFSNIRVEDLDPTYCNNMLFPYSTDYTWPQSKTPGTHLFGVFCDANLHRTFNPKHSEMGYAGPAHINNIRFINVSVTTKPWAQMPYSTLIGQNSQNTVKGVTFKNCTLNGVPYTNMSSPKIGAYPWLNTINPWFEVRDNDVANIAFEK